MSGILIASPRRRQLAQEDGNRILYGLQTQKSSQYSSSRDVAVTIVTSTSALTHPTGPPRPEPAPASPALGWISLQPDLKIKALLYIVFFLYFLAEKVLGWCQWFKAGITPGTSVSTGDLPDGEQDHDRADPSPRRFHCCPANLHRGTFVTIKSNSFH